MQTPRRVDHEGVKPDLLAMEPSGTAKLDRIGNAIALKDRNSYCFRDDGQLITRGRTIDVDRKEQGFSALIILKPESELAG